VRGHAHAAASPGPSVTRGPRAQLLLSRHCPLFARGLPAGARALAAGDALFCASAALWAPAALAVPVVAAATRGAFPLLLTWEWLAAAAPYAVLTLVGAAPLAPASPQRARYSCAVLCLCYAVPPCTCQTASIACRAHQGAGQPVEPARARPKQWRLTRRPRRAVRVWCSAPAELPAALLSLQEPQVLWAAYARGAAGALGHALCPCRGALLVRPAVHTGAAAPAPAPALADDLASPRSVASSLFGSSDAGSLAGPYDGARQGLEDAPGRPGPRSAGLLCGCGGGAVADDVAPGAAAGAKLGAPRRAQRTPVLSLADVHGALAAGRRPGWAMEAWAPAEAAAAGAAAGAATAGGRAAPPGSPRAWARRIGVHVTGGRRDLWAPVLALAAAVAAAAACGVQAARAARPSPVLALAAAWAAAAAAPPALLLAYAAGARGRGLRWCGCAALAAVAAAALVALVATALLLPARYDYGAVRPGRQARVWVWARLAGDAPQPCAAARAPAARAPARRGRRPRMRPAPTGPATRSRTEPRARARRCWATHTCSTRRSARARCRPTTACPGAATPACRTASATTRSRAAGAPARAAAPGR